MESARRSYQRMWSVMWWSLVKGKLALPSCVFEENSVFPPVCFFPLCLFTLTETTSLQRLRVTNMSWFLPIPGNSLWLQLGFLPLKLGSDKLYLEMALDSTCGITSVPQDCLQPPDTHTHTLQMPVSGADCHLCFFRSTSCRSVSHDPSPEVPLFFKN